MLLAVPFFRQLGHLFTKAATSDGCDTHGLGVEDQEDQQGAVARMAQEEAEHRLANLFQLVISNLDRTARSSDGVARRAIDSASFQVSTLFSLHQALGVLGAADKPCRDHFCALGTTLDALLLRPQGHVLTVDVDPGVAEVLLPAIAIRCLSQAVVESVINVAKHAFPAGPGGRVAIRLSRAGDYVACSIVDDGVGGIAGPSRPGSRGMALIDSLAQEAGAQCRWVFGNCGTQVRILWPIEPDAALAHLPGRTGLHC
jgi:two-component sensor histidine kinase